MEHRRLASAAAIAGVALAVVAAFLPLFGGVSALTGDNPTHSWPLNHEVGRALHGAPWRFWDTRTAFGFPVYAEGTGGWFHPWKLLVLGILPNLTGHDLLYVSSFVATGASGFLVATRLGCGAGLGVVAALAIAFSPVVLDTLYNGSYAHSIAWAALCLVGFERWWAAPTRRSFALFAASVGLVLLAGYVPTAYALFVFLGVVLAVRIAFDRSQLRRIPGFLAALAAGTGLAALQILPLLELTSHSVRQESMAVLSAFPWLNFLGGLVFDSDPALYDAARYAYFAAPLGTVLALLAVPFLPRLRDPRAISYCAGIAITVGAAAGPGSWIFEALHVVLPGLDRLRLLSPFLFVAVVPAGVLLAVLLHEATRAEPSRRSTGAVLAVAALFGAFLAVSPPAHAALAWFRHLALALLAVTVLGHFALQHTGASRLAPLLWVAVLAVEIVAFRTGHRAWLPDAVLEPSAVIPQALGARLKDDPEARAIHFPSRAYRAAFDGMVLQHWKSPRYASFVRTGMRTQMPLANLIGELPSAETSGALPLPGYAELLAAMHDELRGRSAAAPGDRALDRWGVRWLVSYGDLGRLPRAAGFDPIWRDPAGDLELLENRHALPRMQWRADPREPAELAAQPAWRRGIERLPWVAPQTLAAFEIEAPAAGTVFAAVPYFPGWTAALDGAVVAPRRAEDGFGMELSVGPGRHRVELRFVPHSFHLGLLVSASAAALLAIRAREGASP